jgi:hypothetical protein
MEGKRGQSYTFHKGGKIRVKRGRMGSNLYY